MRDTVWVTENYKRKAWDEAEAEEPLCIMQRAKWEELGHEQTRAQRRCKGREQVESRTLIIQSSVNALYQRMVIMLQVHKSCAETQTHDQWFQLDPVPGLRYQLAMSSPRHSPSVTALRPFALI